MKEIMRIVGKLLLIINTILFIISFSIALVILFRPFYYYQIKLLNIEENTGYSYKEIKDAYDDVIDYTLYKSDFKTGKLKYSESGKNHFKDCRRLFTIDFVILLSSFIIIIIRKVFFNKIKFKKHSIDYYSSCFIVGFIILILLLSITLGFNRCFIIFHNIFFIGKDNWLFDSSKDQIINILPEQFFMNCVIFIIIICIIFSVSIIIKEKYKIKDI